MASITTLIQKNKFGCKTYYIKLETIFCIEINETTNGTYIVEFLELGIIWNTTLYSFTSSNHILDVISEAMDRQADYYRKSPKYEVPERVFIKDKYGVMEQAYRLFKR